MTELEEKREHFAGLAMQGMQANPSLDLSAEKMAEQAVKYADALLAKLEEKNEH